MRASILGVVGVVAFAACGGSSGDGDASVDAASDAPCVMNAVEGAACVSGQEACPTSGNACCTGFLVCSGTTWRRSFPGCACQMDSGAMDTGVTDTGSDANAVDAGSFACGPSLTCTSSQYCELTTGGPKFADGGTLMSYACRPLPNACVGNSTCACVKANNVSCSNICMDPSMHVTVHCLAP